MLDQSPFKDEDCEFECYCGECENCAESMGGVVPDSLKNFALHLEKCGFHYIDSGDFRHVWTRDKMVVKIPKNGDGIIDNLIEARAWRKYRHHQTSLGIYLAPCRLLSNGCLVMRKVSFDFWPTGRLDESGVSSWKEPRPEWAFKIDSVQVGLYRGRFVAYDYALSIAERTQWEKEMNRCSGFYHNSDWKCKNEGYLP